MIDVLLNVTLIIVNPKNENELRDVFYPAWYTVLAVCDGCPDAPTAAAGHEGAAQTKAIRCQYVE